DESLPNAQEGRPILGGQRDRLAALRSVLRELREGDADARARGVEIELVASPSARALAERQDDALRADVDGAHVERVERLALDHRPLRVHARMNGQPSARAKEIPKAPERSPRVALGYREIELRLDAERGRDGRVRGVGVAVGDHAKGAARAGQ